MSLCAPLLLVLALIIFVDISRVTAALLSIPFALVVAALAVATVDRFAMAIKWWQLVIAAGTQFRFWDALRIQYQTGACGRIIPIAVGGDVLRAYLASRVGVPLASGISSIILEKLISTIVSMSLAFVGLCVLVVQYPDGADHRTLIGIVAFGVIVSGAGLCLSLYAPAHKLFASVLVPFNRWYVSSLLIGARLRRISEAMLRYRGKGRALVVHGTLGMGEFVVQYAKLMLLAYAVGIAVAPIAFVAIIAVALVARRLAGMLESWGVGEGAAVVTATMLGIDLELAVALFVANFAVSTIALIPGFVFYWTHGGDEMISKSAEKNVTEGSDISHSHGCGVTVKRKRTR